MGPHLEIASLQVRIKMRSCWVRVSPGPVRMSLQGTEKDTQRPHEDRSRDCSDAATRQGLSRVMRLLVSRTEREYIFIVGSRHVGSPLLRQPRETNISCTCIRSLMPTATLRGRITTSAFQVRKGRLRAAKSVTPVDIARNRTQRTMALLPRGKQFQTRGNETLQCSKTDGQKAASSPEPPRHPPGLRRTDNHKPRSAGDVRLRVSDTVQDVATGLRYFYGTPHLFNYKDLERQGTQSRGAHERERRIC